MLKPGVGYVAMTGGFNLTTNNEFQEALAGSAYQGHEHAGAGSAGQSRRASDPGSESCEHIPAATGN